MSVIHPWSFNNNCYCFANVNMRLGKTDVYVNHVKIITDHKFK